MNLYEFFEPAVEGYQDVADDNTQPQAGDLRKTKLTLKQINKLRRLNDVRAYEFKENLKQIKKQYAPPAQPAL
jgi:hypothetical protein